MNVSPAFPFTGDISLKESLFLTIQYPETRLLLSFSGNQEGLKLSIPGHSCLFAYSSIATAAFLKIIFIIMRFDAYE
jgi:hypothetical protein